VSVMRTADVSGPEVEHSSLTDKHWTLEGLDHDDDDDVSDVDDMDRMLWTVAVMTHNR